MEKESPYHATYTGPDERLCEHCGTPLFYYVSGKSDPASNHLPNGLGCQRLVAAQKAEKYDATKKELDDLKKENERLGEHIRKTAIDRITPPPQRNLFQLQQDWERQEADKKRRDPRYGVRFI